MVHFTGMSTNPIDRAASAIGGSAVFIERLGISRRTFFNWKAGVIPAEKAREVADLTGIPRHELRPDLWDAPSSSGVQAQPQAAA